MASAKKTKASKEPVRTGRKQIVGIILIGLTIMLLFSLFSYNPWDVSVLQSPPVEPVTNIIGLLGALVSYAAFATFGVAAYVLPILTGVQGVLCVYGEEIRPGMKVIHKLGWMALLLFCASCAMELLQVPLTPLIENLNIPFAGGMVGNLFGSMILMKLLGDIGTTIILTVVVLIAAVCLFDFQLTALFKNPRGTMGKVFGNLQKWMIPPDEDYEDEEVEDEEEDKPEALPEKPKRKRRKKKVEDPKPEEEEIDTFIPASTLMDEEFDSLPVEEPLPFMPEPEVEAPEIPMPVPVPTPQPISDEPSVFKTSAPAPAKKASVSQSDEDSDMVLPAHAEGSPAQKWTLPSISLLQEVAAKVESDGSREEYLRKHLETTLREFGVEARITEVQRGPVVTSFEVLPAAGVRVEKIANLSNNLALALKAESIRVQAPIPGKGVVGIEVPNNKSTVVLAREILESKNWQQSRDWRKGKVALPMLLGVDVSGNYLVGDLAAMPHVLIAGATGSGKSVCMNSLLAGLLMSRTPEQLRLILVDPKIVEFTAYKDLPHLVVPVITDPKKVGLGLRWAITEMENRYKLFAKCGVRNINAFNNRVVAKQGDLFGADDEEVEAAPETLPYIVIVIDELADLMMVAQAEIENYIARLAQLSRAVGIHMILATQRPSVNVITGTIKANFPARIAFQVAQKTDSRTILDSIGADKLLGKGDMLYLSPSSAKLNRAQGAWTSDDEINAIVEHYKEQGKPNYENKITEKIASKKPDLPEQDEDSELVTQAVEVIRQTRRASTSSLQRRLRIGYNRAARLMDQLEEQGVIGPPQGSEPREILIDLDENAPGNGEEST
ncbi:DNA translocase FtsK [Kiritimatiellota bacterium B12222]|nr:DNA translocase FtsK [Kiritimatiellota bacterium B12222]